VSDFLILVKFVAICEAFLDYCVMYHVLCQSKMYEGVSKISGLAEWSEFCKWYSSLPLGAVVSLFL
jgi:hypothetical protein